MRANLVPKSVNAIPYLKNQRGVGGEEARMGGGGRLGPNHV